MRKKTTKKSRYRMRTRKMCSGINVAISILLAAVAVLMINYLSAEHFRRWRIAIRDFYNLSPKTRSILSTLDKDVRITVFFSRNHQYIDHLRNVLKEYDYAAEGREDRLQIEFVDPDRDLARARQLAQEYGLKEQNSIVVECSGRTKFIQSEDIFEFELRMGGQEGLNKKLASYKAEQALSSAIRNVTQTGKPVVYFIAGHGERDINDYSRHSGYSAIARIMRRDNIELRTLFLAENSRIPVDCSALVIAGPDRKYSDAESKIVSGYLEKSGKAMFLVDPAVQTGLNGLLKDWGVNLCPEVAVGLTLTGRELVVNTYGDHPITRNLRNVTTMFYMPRCVEPIPNEGADKPSLTVLATNTDDGWGETKLEQDPPRYNPGSDVPGPVPIAVAAERGPRSRIDVEVDPSKLVVIGDSAFVSNGALRTGVGGNKDFFMSALNWLLERESLMRISPRRPMELKPEMTRRQWINARLILIGGIPGLFILIGIVVWFNRRK